MRLFAHSFKNWNQLFPWNKRGEINFLKDQMWSIRIYNIYKNICSTKAIKPINHHGNRHQKGKKWKASRTRLNIPDSKNLCSQRKDYGLKPERIDLELSLKATSFWATEKVIGTCMKTVDHLSHACSIPWPSSEEFSFIALSDTKQTQNSRKCKH